MVTINLTVSVLCDKETMKYHTNGILILINNYFSKQAYDRYEFKVKVLEEDKKNDS